MTAPPEQGRGVWVSWVRERFHDGEREELSQEVPGRIYWQGESVGYLFYREGAEMDGQQTCLKLQHRQITLIRQGQFRLRQVFRAGATTLGTYHTPYGSYPLTCQTLECSWTLAEWLQVRLTYLLRLADEEQGRFVWQIRADGRSLAGEGLSATDGDWAGDAPRPIRG